MSNLILKYEKYSVNRINIFSIRLKNFLNLILKKNLIILLEQLIWIKFKN